MGVPCHYWFVFGVVFGEVVIWEGGVFINFDVAEVFVRECGGVIFHVAENKDMFAFF